MYYLMIAIILFEPNTPGLINPRVSKVLGPRKRKRITGIDVKKTLIKILKSLYFRLSAIYKRSIGLCSSKFIKLRKKYRKYREYRDYREYRECRECRECKEYSEYSEYREYRDYREYRVHRE